MLRPLSLANRVGFPSAVKKWSLAVQVNVYPRTVRGKCLQLTTYLYKALLKFSMRKMVGRSIPTYGIGRLHSKE
jgi:hypothetical protein